MGLLMSDAMEIDAMVTDPMLKDAEWSLGTLTDGAHVTELAHEPAELEFVHRSPEPVSWMLLLRRAVKLIAGR